MPGKTSASSPAAIPTAASTTAKKIGAKASIPAARVRAADGRSPRSRAISAYTQAAVISGAITRKLTGGGSGVATLAQRGLHRGDRAIDRSGSAELGHDRLRDHAGRDVGLGPEP